QIDWTRQRDLFFGPYAQDDWKVSKRLTLNLGFRWDLYTQPVDALNTGGVFDPNLRSNLGRLGVIRLPGKNGNSRAIIQGHHKNFAPRFGFAYQATSKLVVRGGYGIFYGSFENRGGSPNLGYNYPFQFNFSFPSANVVSPFVYPYGQIATLGRDFLSIPTNTALVP